ncbi:hypothetical protein [Paenisporosarcina sp. TG-14]|uniref:hypothetical protein n=1 Tax=Paenisporosarcina sp. TG-14 TaxID=1231057 RepID=UPI00030A21EA|nr:hypothetical protein [Paenisporosarcina sp. TG-14]
MYRSDTYEAYLCFETKEELEEYEEMKERFKKRLNEYQKVLKKEFALTSSPKGII